MKQDQFDKNVSYALRVELLNGKVLIYPVDTENKQMLMDMLMQSSGALSFIGFETSLNRKVAINKSSIARTTFCFDHKDSLQDAPMKYRDNFGVLDGTEEMEDDEELADNLPKAIIYHKGEASEDEQSENPMLYYDLDPGCLAHFSFIGEEESPLQFLNLTDDDGEESFIPVENIMVMEFDSELFDIEE